MFVDTHCHLDFDDFAKDRGDILVRAKRAGVQQMVTIGIDLSSSRRAIALAENNGEIYATVGIHPHNAKVLSPEDIQELLSLGSKSQVVAYGEIGLDFFRNYQAQSVQVACMEEQLNLAHQLGLPVVIHDREAHQEIFQLLQENKIWEIGGAMHCFSGDWSFAKKCLDLGLYLSIAGPVTFDKSQILQELAQNCPLDRLLIETDAPFLAPVPKRGKRNEPAFVVYTAEKIASLRKLPLEDVARQTSLNARRLFRLPTPQPSRIGRIGTTEDPISNSGSKPK
jgi:TatD DNase family protein